MKLKSIILAGFSLISLGIYTSCEDMMDTSSSLVLFSEDNTLDQATDTVYSVMGIISKMQVIADRTVLLGEIRGDLVELTSEASAELQELAGFTTGTDNSYNTVRDYYAVINNCNYFLATADTSLTKRNEYVFMKEYAAVKAYRAWTYLQLATIYDSVPFVTEPILTEETANKDYPIYGIEDICNYFIDDLIPYINTALPGYGAINGLDSKKFFIPVRVLLGDLCLWAERYMEAAQYYHGFLTLDDNEVTTGLNQASWSSESTTFVTWSNNYSYLFSTVGNDEIISYIPMESSAAEGIYSNLRDIFNSTANNSYYNKATPSSRLIELSRSQTNCIVYTNGVSRDTLYAPEKNEEHPLWIGDLRLASVYTTTNTIENQSPTGNYSSKSQTISKFATDHVILYRRGQIYLRFAEALNRAGFPESAFAVLKYGLYPTTVNNYISSSERDRALTLLSFSQYAFNANNTLGIHSRGCGNAAANNNYVIPVLSSFSDSINYVEDLICDEMALETSFEGFRFFDLIRMSLHRNDDTFLAGKIAARKGLSNNDQLLYNTLLNKENWYLPLK